MLLAPLDLEALRGAPRQPAAGLAEDPRPAAEAAVEGPGEGPEAAVADELRMPRHFNTAGPCRPEDHYMLPPEDRLPGVRSLIAEKAYFVIHAPRQTGKTTCFRTLARSLDAEGEYAAVHASCEAGQTLSGEVEPAVSAVLRSIARQAAVLEETLRPEPVELFDGVPANSRLITYLTRWCERSPKPVVLFLDEVDALLGDGLISVLRQLREAPIRSTGK